MLIIKNPEVSKDSGVGKENVINSSIPSDPYANVQRQFSEVDMNSPAVKKMLLNENDRLNRENEKLQQVREKYYARDKEAAVLEEKLKQSTGSEVLYTLCTSGGAALVGFSKVFWGNGGWILLLMGFIFIVGGILFKIVKR